MLLATLIALTAGVALLAPSLTWLYVIFQLGPHADDAGSRTAGSSAP